MIRTEAWGRLLQRADRRDFLKLLAVAGAGVAGAGGLRAAMRALDDDGVTVTRVAMGTNVSVTAVCNSPARARDVIESAFGEMDRLIGLYSRHDAASALSVLNDTGRVDGPPEFAVLLRMALGVHAETSGAFDPTVKPVIDLMERSPGASDAEIRDAATRAGAGRVHVIGTRVRLDDGAGITLDGIAKGYIADRMSAILAAAGVRDHLIDAGGDIRVSGRPCPERSWKVGVADPDGNGYVSVIPMTRGAVATSGRSVRLYNEAGTRHHLIDPRTGTSPLELTSASVVSPDAMHADALSTAVFVRGMAEGLLLAKSAGVECLLDDAGTPTRTPGWPQNRT